MRRLIRVSIALSVALCAGSASAQTVSGSTLSISNAGTFSTTGVTTFGNTVVNNCNLSQQYQDVQGPNGMTAATTGCITGPSSNPGSGLNQVDGLFGVAVTSEGTRAVGGSFYSYVTGANAYGYGSNPLVQDKNDSTTGHILVGEEIDVQPQNPIANYTTGSGLHIALYNQANNAGSAVAYPFQAINFTGWPEAGTPAAWKVGLNFSVGTFASDSVIYNINALGNATLSENYNSPIIDNIYETYYNGSESSAEGWQTQAFVKGGMNPNLDWFLTSHNIGTSPTGQSHYWGYANNIDLAFQHSDSSTWDVIEPSAATGTTYTDTMPGATGTIAVIAGSVTNDNCAKLVNSGGTLTVADSGVSCGTSAAHGTLALNSGTATVSTRSACALGSTCAYQLTYCGVGGTPGILSVASISAGSSFTVNSTSSSDSSTVCWRIN